MKIAINQSASQLLLTLLLILLSKGIFAETIWIDVRSAFEHKIDHIEGDLRISYREAAPLISELYPNKETEIRLYCLSGVRAEKALTALKAAGYTNISNAGGINNARKERGLSE